jgi:hypothetical protein
MSSLTPRLDRAEKNYIINGDMRIAQRGTSFAAATNGQFVVDRFRYVKVGTMVHTVSQDTDVPTLFQSGYLFQNSVRLNLTTAETSLGASDFCEIRHIIEGYNWANLAQKAFTISFWVKATTPGTYSVFVGNTGFDQKYISTYTINSASTWEQKSITIAASPSAGTWDYANGAGAYIHFVIASGSSINTSSLNSWISTAGLVGASTQTNGVNTGATDFRITGVSVTEGSGTGTQFSTFSRSFQGELAACQRYYNRNPRLYGEVRYTTTDLYFVWDFAVQMRTSPTTALLTTSPTGESPISAASVGATGSVLSLHASASDFISFWISGFPVLTAHMNSFMNAAQISVDAEL